MVTLRLCEGAKKPQETPVSLQLGHILVSSQALCIEHQIDHCAPEALAQAHDLQDLGVC